MLYPSIRVIHLVVLRLPRFYSFQWRSAQASSTLIFPRLSFAPQDLTGIAIVNPGDETASVTFTAYGVDGLQTSLRWWPTAASVATKSVLTSSTSEATRWRPTTVPTSRL